MPHIPLRRASPLPVRQRVSRSANLSLCLFCQLHFGTTGVSSGLPRSRCQGGSRCAGGVRREGHENQEGRGESWGSLQTSLRPPHEGGDRTRPGCGQSQAVAGLQRGSPGRWRVLEPKSLLEESAILQDPGVPSHCPGAAQGKCGLGRVRWRVSGAAAGPSGSLCPTAGGPGGASSRPPPWSREGRGS